MSILEGRRGLTWRRDFFTIWWNSEISAAGPAAPCPLLGPRLAHQMPPKSLSHQPKSDTGPMEQGVPTIEGRSIEGSAPMCGAGSHLSNDP